MDSLVTSRPVVRPSLFVSTAVCALATIAGCWLLALKYNLPSGVWCPPISLTGFLFPERAVYMLGFIFTFLLGAAACRQLEILFKAEAPESKLLRFAWRTLYVALMGMLGQALVPFQSNVFEAKFPQDLELQTVAHLIFAAVFFYGAQLHALIVLGFRIMTGNRSNLPVKTKLVMLTGNLFCMYALPYLLEFTDISGINMEGVCQRLGVLFILGFFADYSRDLRKISYFLFWFSKPLLCLQTEFHVKDKKQS